MIEDWVAIRRDLNRLEKWDDRSLIKFNKGKCKIVYLGRGKPPACTGALGDWLEADPWLKRTWESWWTRR